MAADVAAPAAVNAWPPAAALAFQLGVAHGLTPAQATDFAAAQYGESGFNPNALNKSSGAAGLYQLLSSGYVNKANALGGVFNPRANIEAILPNYAGYYGSHPGSPVPGAAASAVEASGEPASYYAQGYQHLPGVPPPVAPQALPQDQAAAPSPFTPELARLIGSLGAQAEPSISSRGQAAVSPLLALARSLLT